MIGKPWWEVFPDGVIYSPNATSYAYACYKRRKESPRQAIVLIGDVSDKDLIREAEAVSRQLPCSAPIITTWGELENSSNVDLLYIATHGYIATDGESSDLSTTWEQLSHRMGYGWSLLFDGRRLTANDSFSGRIKLSRGSVVVLSTCSVGRLMGGPIHELNGLIQAIFYAGAATVLAARWPIFYETAEEVFVETIRLALGSKVTFGASFRMAIENAKRHDHNRHVMIGPEAETFFWGPFTLFGCGD